VLHSRDQALAFGVIRGASNRTVWRAYSSPKLHPKLVLQMLLVTFVSGAMRSVGGFLPGISRSLFIIDFGKILR